MQTEDLIEALTPLSNQDGGYDEDPVHRVGATVAFATPDCTPDRPIIVIGDVHGHARPFGLLLQAMIRAHPHADIVLLGDLIDRGPQSYEALRLAIVTVLSVTGDGTSRIAVLLPGNHEQMMLAALSPHEIVSDTITASFIANGGNWAVSRMERARQPAGFLDRMLPKSMAHRVRANYGSVYNWMLSRPMHCKPSLRGKLLMVHAGIDPSEPTSAWLARQKIIPPHDDIERRRTRAFETGALWIREPFLRHNSRFPEGNHVVHGHSPDKCLAISLTAGITPVLQNPHRLCLDAGSYRTGVIAGAVLFNGHAQYHSVHFSV